jgi:hypothetical protein
MSLVLPEESPDSTFIAESHTLTVILNANDSISYYDGRRDQLKHAMFGEIRNVIQQKQVNLANNHVGKNELVVVIKPSKESTYKNLVDALDEVYINDVRHYFVADPGVGEVL